jgi:Zn-dependent protease with chaperone function
VRLCLKSVITGSLFCAACGPISKLPPLAPAEIEAEQRKQQIDQVRDYFAQRGRLHDVAFRVRAANHRDCENRVQADIGLSAGTVESLPRKFRSFAHEALSVSWTQATVLSVAVNSPAAAAGIRPGDHLLTFNNEAVPRTDTAGWIGDFARNSSERPIQVLVRRNGLDEMHTVTPVMACSIPIRLVTDSTLNAFTTGSEIVIHSSLLRIARSDAQLAMIVGHELAHANLGHLDKQRANQALGWTSGAVIDVGILLGTRITTGLTFAREFARAGQRAYSVTFEREADYVGAYYAARAGYDLAGAEEFWRSYSLESPDSIRLATTHPVTPVRFVQIQKVVAEIADKQRRNEPLIPELRVTAADTDPTAQPETVR